MYANIGIKCLVETNMRHTQHYTPLREMEYVGGGVGNVVVVVVVRVVVCVCVCVCEVIRVVVCAYE